MAGLNDTALWRKEYWRQFQCIKLALHSLRVQTAELQKKKPTPLAVREMAHYFSLVEQCFQILNTPEPANTDCDFLPGPQRREFLSDVKHGEVRT